MYVFFRTPPLHYILSHPLNHHEQTKRSPHPNRLLAHGRIFIRHRGRLPTAPPTHLHGPRCKEHLLESLEYVITLVVVVVESR